MRHSRTFRSFFAAIVMALLPAGAIHAQQRPQQPPAQQQSAEEMQALYMEYQQIQEELGQIEERALEADPALEAERLNVVETVESTMLEMHPEVEDHLERFESLRGEFEAAQAAGDNEKIQALAMEAQQVQQQLQGAQAAAMQREDVAETVESFRVNLVNKMKEVEPRTEQLMARVDELTEKLSGGS